MKDPDQVAALFEASNRRIRGILIAMGASPELAEDLVQEAFARLLSRWHRLRAYDDPEAWLRTVAMRLFISERRRERTASRHTAGSRLEDMAPVDATRIDMDAAIARLPVDQRAVIVLHYVVDLSLEQISACLNVPEGTVKSRLSRGRVSLGQSLGEDQPHG